jgi:predicted metal-dependent phosphoesterase TrpH
MGTADLHLHSTYSDGICSIEEIFIRAKEMKLDVVSLTDHNTLAGVSEAQDIAERLGIGFIPGEEISTLEGHLVALFIHKPISRGQSLYETLLQVGEQGGIAFAPHLFSKRFLSGIQGETIATAMQKTDVHTTLVGVEVFGTGNLFNPRYTALARDVAMRFELAELGNSDSHQYSTIGQYQTRFEGTTPEEVRISLLAQKTQGFQYQEVHALDIWMSFAIRKLWMKGKKQGYSLGRRAFGF